MWIGERLGIHKQAKSPEVRRQRVASYVAFTHEDPLTHNAVVLLGQGRPLEDGTPQWGFPGGGRKPGYSLIPWFHGDLKTVKSLEIHFTEDPKDTARREVREELGVRLRRRYLKLAFAVEAPHAVTGEGQQFAYLHVPVKYDLSKTTRRSTPSEITALQWVGLEDAKEAHLGGEITEEVFQGVVIAIAWHRTHLSQQPATEKELEKIWRYLENQETPVPRPNDNFR